MPEDMIYWVSLETRLEFKNQVVAGLSWPAQHENVMTWPLASCYLVMGSNIMYPLSMKNLHLHNWTTTSNCTDIPISSEVWMFCTNNREQLCHILLSVFLFPCLFLLILKIYCKLLFPTFLAWVSFVFRSSLMLFMYLSCPALNSRSSFNSFTTIKRNKI